MTVYLFRQVISVEGGENMAFFNSSVSIPYFKGISPSKIQHPLFELDFFQINHHGWPKWLGHLCPLGIYALWVQQSNENPTAAK
ncbi:hypothetical protein DGMP_09160 [Desulfomarina profundi]|uniref:Uncharacterized protein n=1 Tax=Desulfomarina profundi TaxID=2772557 RepID=A0A8D5FF83_9BACT|nr:hypothetical protein DGMP_09160 [Desulfomarina profundi]